jgi:hypothetical protein
MVGGKQRNVLFFGSLAISVAGHEVYDDDVVAQLERQNASIKLRTTVTTTFRKTNETFSATAVTPLYEIRVNESPAATMSMAANTFNSSGTAAPQQSGEGSSSLHRRTPSHSQHRHDPHHHQRRQRAAFLPVLLELADGVSAEEVPSIEEMDRELRSTTPSDNPRAATDAGEATTTAALNSGAAVTPNYATCTVRIEVDMSRSGSHAGPIAIQEVVLPSLNYLARHDICTIVRVPLSTSTILKSCEREVDAAVAARESAQLQSSGSLEDAAISAAGVAVHLYVVVRVVSLAEKARLVFEADDALQRMLDMPEPRMPGLSMRLTQRGEAPYGALPLTELYRHYKRFFEHAWNAVLKHSDAVVQHLVTAPRQREAEASFPHRWNALTEIDLRPLLLGEQSFAPLLLTLAHCTNLRSLYAEGNQLGDYTCGRLAALFSHHRCLAYIGLSRNGIHEAGGEQLVRLLKRNLRITALPCDGNYFSDAMRRRIASYTSRNASVIADDPLNIFARSYDYLTELSSLPEVTQRQALRTWAMLSAAPVGDVDVMVRNLTTSSQRTIGDSPQVAMQRAKMARRARETFSLIPPAALAPLLNEVMRTVYVTMSRVVPDPLVRSLFTDVETIVARQQAQRDARRGVDDVDDDDDVINAVEERGSGAAAIGGETTTALPREVQAALGSAAPTAPVAVERLFARSFLRMVVTVFRGLSLATPWAEIAAVLTRIGRMHRDLGVVAEDYWLAVHVFMASVRISCGAESYDADHASSFLAILALAVRTTGGFDLLLA